MSEQLYRSVKASQRLPQTPGRYFVIVGRQVIPNNSEQNQVAKFTSHKEWYLENHHHSNDFYWIAPDAWLEPLPLNADVEQAAQEYVDKEETVDLVFGNDVTDISDHLKSAFIAGAGYGNKDYEEVLKDHKRLVRELDEIINGKEGMAKQASLCDIVAQLKNEYGKGGDGKL